MTSYTLQAGGGKVGRPFKKKGPMAAFWQWKVAEELQFPAECIVFEEGDVPEVRILYVRLPPFFLRVSLFKFIL